MKRASQIFAASAIFAIDHLVFADKVEQPIRLKIDSNLLTSIFQKGDQRMFSAFADLEVDDVAAADETPLFSDLQVSVTTLEGIDPSSYDFDLSLNDAEKGFLGFQGLNLRVVGSGKLQDTDFTFEAPVEQLRLECEIVPETSTEVLNYNKDAVMPLMKDF